MYKTTTSIFSLCRKIKKRTFLEPERAELSVFRAQKCLQERFQGKFKSSFCGSQNSYKKIADLYTIQTEKSLKFALERKVFIVVLRGKAGIFLKIVKILIGMMQEKGVKRGFKNSVFEYLSKKPPKKQRVFGSLLIVFKKFILQILFSKIQGQVPGKEHESLKAFERAFLLLPELLNQELFFLWQVCLLL